MASSATGPESYNAEKASSVDEPSDVSADPASGTFFTADFRRHDDLNQMLDSNKDALKLEAMKRIIGMIAKGRDASDLFPAVVKNVVSKNIEVKKLVYVYLVRYAEEQQDLALLSISTFQRALKDPNQLIRASALRVLSSIRVPVIVPIMMLAIKDSVSDMSPYVRKTAAHAIPKLHSLDPEQKDELILVIDRLLNDKTTLVAGSVIMAYEQVCPDRLDLIHKHYRKLCNLVVDVDEWGQVTLLQMLTRYARTQFIDPNEHNLVAEEKKFYESSEEEGGSGSESGEGKAAREKRPEPKPMDLDHRLLLRVTKPLLQSRNASVVMSVAQLYFHCAPVGELIVLAKPLVRLIKSHREVQAVVLSNIASMTIERASMFEPYLKSFFVRPMDPTHIRLLKLEILTNLATETTISTILRELQTYVSGSDADFVGATIQAIGRCASRIPEVTDTCMTGLVHLMSNRREIVVAESVVVIKTLLQMDPKAHKDIIAHMGKMVDKITVPMARASILWLIGEYCDLVPDMAPDVLRKLAKSFVQEEDIVKLQVLTLATKLLLTSPLPVVRLLAQYVFQLAKYDQNYDIRDRARFLRHLVLRPDSPGGPAGDGAAASKQGYLAKHAKKIFLATKPAPKVESKFKDRDSYQLGSLSHYLNRRVSGYQDLPAFPDIAPDPSVRNVTPPPVPRSQAAASGRHGVLPGASAVAAKARAGKKKEKGFYSDSSSPEDDESEEESSEEESSSEESSGEEESSSEEESSDESDNTSSDVSGEEDSEKRAKRLATISQEVSRDPSKKPVASAKPLAKKADPSSEEETSTEEESSSEEEQPVKVKAKASKELGKKKEVPQKSLDLLLDLEDAFVTGPPTGAGPLIQPPSGPMLTATPVGPTPAAPGGSASSAIIKPLQVASPLSISTSEVELLNRVTGNGVSATYRFTRGANLYSDRLASVEIKLTNHGTSESVNNIRIGNTVLQQGMSIQGFPSVKSLSPGETFTATCAIDFNDTVQPAKFSLLVGDEKNYQVSITAPVGELLNPVALTEEEFLTRQSKLKGMTEDSAVVSLPLTADIGQAKLSSRVAHVANVALISTSVGNVHRFAGKTLASDAVVLITLKMTPEDKKCHVTVNCDKITFCSLLLKDLKTSLVVSQ